MGTWWQVRLIAAHLTMKSFQTIREPTFRPICQVSLFFREFVATHNADGLDEIPNISSNGGGIPLTIGRLAWFSQQPNGATYSIRRDGVLVRATAIADSRFATRVWPAATSSEIYGALPFGIRKTDFVAEANLANFIFPTTTTLTHFGQVAEFAASGSYANETGYVAIIDDSFSPARVIGFYLASPTAVPDRFPNASSRISDAWDVVGELTAVLRSQITASRLDAANQSIHSILTAPALVRSVR